MVKGLASLERKFRRIPKAVKRQNIRDLEAAGELLTGEMRRRAPFQDGNLRTSITFKFGGGRSRGIDSTAITVSAGDETTLVYDSRGGVYQNAFLQEFGHKNNPGGTPYFFPTYRINKRRIRGRITRGTRKAIKQGAG